MTAMSSPAASHFLRTAAMTLTIIDTAGGWSDTATAAIGAADLCLIPVRPSPADIEAAVPTLAAIRERGKPFAFVLNQTPARSARLEGAAASLGETAASLHVTGVLALPRIVLRNDQQDALGKGLAVTEYAHEGKSADEIRGAVAMGLGPADDRSRRKMPEVPSQAAASPANEETELRAAG